MSDVIWMQHDEHLGYAQLPDIPYWRANGWNPSGPPPEPDLLRDPPTEQPEEPETPATEPGFSTSGETGDNEEMTRG